MRLLQALGRMGRRLPSIGMAAMAAVSCAGPASSHCEDAVVPGRVQCLRIGHGLLFYSYVPRDLDPAAPIFVAVHGVSRDADRLARSFAPYADATGAALLAPLFDNGRYNDYQRILRERGARRADIALERMVENLRARLGLTTERILLYGHSGGAQFAHRYMMAHPERVAALAVSAAGYYTWPDALLRYPLGLRDSVRVGAPAFDPGEFLRVPVCVFVGAGDLRRDRNLYTGPRVDDLQGRNRLARARIWVEKMQSAARAAGYTTAYRYEVIADAKHGFGGLMEHGLGDRVFACLRANAGTDGWRPP